MWAHTSIYNVIPQMTGDHTEALVTHNGAGASCFHMQTFLFKIIIVTKMVAPSH